MSTRNGPRELAEAIGPAARAAAGAIRRFAIGVTSKALWQLVGHRLLDNTVETHTAEVFNGIGIYARPPTDGKPEAIVVHPGGAASNPCIVGLRDEATRQAVFAAIGELEAGETAVFNRVSVAIFKAGGDIEIRSLGGTAGKVALYDELKSLRDFVYAQFSASAGHVHTVVGGATTAMVTVNPSPPPAAPSPFVPANPVGTSKVKLE